VILGMIHQHMILFMKCHFLGSCELCESFPHRSELAFRILLALPQYVSVRVFFSALAHIKMEARNQTIVEHEIRLALCTQPQISKLAIQLQVNRRIEKICEI